MKKSKKIYKQKQDSSKSHKNINLIIKCKKSKQYLMKTSENTSININN